MTPQRRDREATTRPAQSEPAECRTAILLAALLPLPACTGAPAVNVVGSYFPAWLLCALIGIAAAVCLRQVLVLMGLENSLVAPLLTHAAIALAVSLAVWLLWFGH